MFQCAYRKTENRKGLWAAAILLSCLQWGSTAARGEDKIISPDQAIAVLEQLEARIERVQWVFTSQQGKMAAPHDRANPTFETDTSIKSTVVLEPISGRYRCDIEGVSRWIEGTAPYLGYRHNFAFDGKRQWEYKIGRPGTEIPQEGESLARGTIKGETSGEFLNEGGWVSGGAMYFPPYLFERKLSELLQERLRRQSPLRITEDAQGLWTIRTDENVPLLGGFFLIFFDPNRGVTTGARRMADETARPGEIASEWFFDLVQTENGFWVPRQVDYVNNYDRDHRINRCLYSEVKVNQPVKDSIFTFAIPLNTQVTDDLEGKRYIAGKGAVNDAAATLAYAQAHGLRLTETAPPPPLPFPWGYRVVLPAVVLTILLGLAVMRRWWKRGPTVRRGLLLLLAVQVSPVAQAADLSESGEWTVKHGDTVIHMSQCGMNVTVLTMECFGLPYNVRLMAEALPPTREGICFADIRTYLEASGLRCEARQGVDLAALMDALRPNTMALFAGRGPDGYHHYLAAINHPRHGCLLLDPPNHSPFPLRDALGASHLQPLSGLVLFVGRDPETRSQASRVTLSPETVDLGTFSITDSDASNLERRRVTVTNSSERPVLVSQVFSACNCVTPEWRGGVLRPGESREVTFRIVKAGWGKGALLKETPFLFADKSTTAITWKGVGLSNPEIHHLKLSADTLRIDLDQLAGGESLEREVRVSFDGFRVEDLQVSCDAPWLAAGFQSEGAKSGIINIRISIDEQVRNEEHVEGNVLLAATKGKPPAAVKVILSRKPFWRAAPALLTVSRGAAQPRKAEVLPTRGSRWLVKRLRFMDLPSGLDVQTAVEPSGTGVLSFRASSSTAVGLHVVKVAVGDERGRSSTVSFLVRVVD